ncbi:DEAD/DEAH box helicase, partial [Phosphitispora fastidiosa]|uniref:DEAD/DEAH box helicase n=1 Tax=Phosphitispora fastidiosa TaxID=2837202 RepID=UPI001E61EAC1
KTGGYHAFMTHDPRVDAVFMFPGQDCAALEILTPYLPVGISAFLLETAFGGKRMNGKDPAYETLVRAKAEELYSLLAQLERVLGQGTLLKNMAGYPARLVMKNLKILRAPGSRVCREVLGALRGRILFREEVEKSLAENSHSAGDSFIADILQVLALKGEIEIRPALGFTRLTAVTCYRCGSQTELRSRFWEPEFSGRNGKVFRAGCQVCGFPSVYCEQCNTLGDSRLCRGLYAAPGSALPIEMALNVKPRGVPPLTPAQQAASEELVRFVSRIPALQSKEERDEGPGEVAAARKFFWRKPKRNIKEILIWAVCGAGKTEVVFGAIAETLNRGGRVLYAIPRRDVVRELAPRLQAAFREVELLASYGGSVGKYRSARLVTATTHQVVRYYRNFDLVILDEVDAYPYQGNDMLRMAVQRAVKPEGGTIYLTATPDKAMLANTRSGVTGLVTIPARYHGYPVPEPRLEKAALFLNGHRGGSRNSGHNSSRNCGCDSGEINQVIVNLLLGWLADPGRQAFIFLPTVGMVEEYGPVLADAVFAAVQSSTRAVNAGRKPASPDDLLRFSHARDAQRDRKRDDFKNGKFPLFVTTTIMERGITVKKANVLVLEADWEQVFDEGTLIQMAGRAGRSIEYPDGEVVFAGKTISDAMGNARKKIVFLNRTAREQGYLKPGL